jgi:hypothetical protein
MQVALSRVTVIVLSPSPSSTTSQNVICLFMTVLYCRKRNQSTGFCKLDQTADVIEVVDAQLSIDQIHSFP